MDVKHTRAYGRVTFPDGSFELIEVGGIILTLNQIGRLLHESRRAFNGTVVIELGKQPFPAVKADDEIRFASTHGFDPATIMKEEDLPESMKESLALAREVEDDDMLREYRSMTIPSIRNATTPERQAELKRYVESTYKDTPHWDGSHKW